MRFCMGSASDYSRSGTSGRSPRGSWGPKAADDRHPKMMLVATCTGRVLVQHRRGRSRESSLYEVGQPAEPMRSDLLMREEQTSRRTAERRQEAHEAQARTAWES